MSLSVDLNADLGEGAGHDEQLLQLVSSANIACAVRTARRLLVGSSGMAAACSRAPISGRVTSVECSDCIRAISARTCVSREARVLAS